MTASPPTTAAPVASKPDRTALRITIGVILILFGMAMAALMVWAYAMTKEPLTLIDAAFAGVPIVLGFGAAIPASFTFVVSTVKEITPPNWGRRDGDH